MSEYSDFASDDSTEFICPACGALLTTQGRTEDGWNCKCGDFIPKNMAVNPYKGLSNKHKKNNPWR